MDKEVLVALIGATASVILALLARKEEQKKKKSNDSRSGRSGATPVSSRPTLVFFAILAAGLVLTGVGVSLFWLLPSRNPFPFPPPTPTPAPKRELGPEEIVRLYVQKVNARDEAGAYELLLPATHPRNVFHEKFFDLRKVKIIKMDPSRIEREAATVKLEVEITFANNTSRVEWETDELVRVDGQWKIKSITPEK